MIMSYYLMYDKVLSISSNLHCMHHAHTFINSISCSILDHFRKSKVIIFYFKYTNVCYFFTWLLNFDFPASKYLWNIVYDFKIWWSLHIILLIIQIFKLIIYPPYLYKQYYIITCKEINYQTLPKSYIRNQETMSSLFWTSLSSTYWACSKSVLWILWTFSLV